MNVHRLPVQRVTPEDGHYFFGYYDKCPWSPDESMLLAHRVPFCDRFPTASDRAEVGIITNWRESPAFTPLATTGAWNWQQGAHLQWFGDRVLFNDREGDALVARVMEPSGELVRTIPHPVYAVRGDAVLTLSFGRLTRLRREYGIPGIEDAFASDDAPEDDGVFALDPETGERRLIVSIRACSDEKPSPFGEHAAHYVNHLMWNPSATRFCFLHRFDRADGILQSRLFTANADGSDLRLLMEGMVSHYDWRDDSTILAWGGERTLLAGGSKGVKGLVMNTARRTLKPVYYAMGKPRFLMNRIVGDSYLLIEDSALAPRTSFAKGELTCDGHCTWHGDLVLTDGYPDMKQKQPLYLWDAMKDEGTEIGRFWTPRELDGELRVDLHPRFSRSGRMICIDSAMEGSRAMYVLTNGDESHG